MKGKTRTKAEKDFQDKISAIGCIVCHNQGIENHYVSIHHIDGRTKLGAHMNVLPLCYPHHQQIDNNKPKRWLTLHSDKNGFERLYGTQEELLAQCNIIICQ